LGYLLAVPASAPNSAPWAGPKALRLLVLLASSTLALLVALVFVWLEGPGADPTRLSELALESDEVREAAVRELVARSEGMWDAYPDPDVGRVLQREVEEREFRGVAVSSNAFGMREHAYELPKPEGVTRVCLLGDSFVFGYKVAAEERLGVVLEEALEERAGVECEIECLHLGISSWNVQAECAYLRRQLHLLEPDLVVQVVVVNDLDDLQGVRGFGAMGGFSPQQRHRANGVFTMMSPASLWPRRVQNFLLDGLDHVSRDRYARAAQELRELARAVEETGARYLLLIAWDSFNPMARKYLAPDLPEEQVAFVSRTFTEDLRYRIGPSDRHWNPAGHERMARLLYGLIVERDLLPACAPGPWDAAATAVSEIHRPGQAEAGLVEPFERGLRSRASQQIQPFVDIPRLKQRNAKQVYGGVDSEGHVAPFAAMILSNPGAETLRILGRRTEASLRPDAVARVFVDELEVGRLALVGEERIDESFALPAELRERPFLSVRLEATDHALLDVARGTCSAFLLERAELR